MRTRPRKFLRTGMVVLLLLTATAAVVFRNDDDGTVRVVAVFQDASPLREGNLVKAYGVQVGLIDGVRLVNGQAHVEMQVQRSALPLHSDATAQIRPMSLLGERFVQLEAGSAGAPLQAEPLTIPADRTSRAMDLEDVFNTLDDPTSGALAALVTTLGEGMQGRGDDVTAALAAVEPALSQVDRLTEILDTQNASLNRILEIGQLHTSAFADRDGATLDQLVGAAEQTLGTVAANRVAVDDAIAQLPSTLTSARRALRELAGVADATTPVLASVRPVTDDLTAISGEIHEFADAADPALASLPPVLERLDAMLDEARPVIEGLRPAAGDLHSVAGSVRPIAEELLVHEPGTPSSLENLMNGLANWAMATSGYDGVSHYFRAAAVVTPETARQMLAGFAPPGLVPAEVPDVPGEVLPGPTTELPGLLPSVVPAPPASDPGNATGLSQEQEQSLVGQLLGGGR
ncbi:MlaD family protein [Pseudonocardia bannensis]|uniref:MCE family protein n=1 Tax=Pseudonocardia bannensis TaxID=630973 RepID=A0A848DKF4_9PSEU|nr:MlaD family protein [Pseudonocardia bannensis]NMH92904.1 MCE family protein [Pseudonocardia bannensis]